jgi:hypothetical protein
MRRELSRAVRARFARRLAQTLPQFLPVRDALVPTQCTVYGWRPVPDLAFFLVLMTHPKMEEQFTVEAAWSRNGEFPSWNLPGRPRDVPELDVRRDPPENSAFRFRIARLWHPNGHPWWDVRSNEEPPAKRRRPERHARTPRDSLREALARQNERVEPMLAHVDALVDHAVDHIVSDVLPYFHEEAHRLGVVLPPGPP